MQRRHFLALTAANAVATALPLPAIAQETKLPRIVFVWAETIVPAWRAAYRQGLTDYGLIDGKNVTVDTIIVPTTAAADYSIGIASALKTNPAVIVVHATVPSLAAKALTTTTPIVFGAATDPVGLGVIASLAHPGGNLTGSSLVVPDIVGKQLQILKEIFPAMKRIVALNVAGSPAIKVTIDEIVNLAKRFNVEVVLADFYVDRDIPSQFPQVVSAAPDLAWVPAAPYMVANHDVLCDLQIKYKVPLLWPGPVSGTDPIRALVGYGPIAAVEIRKTGAYIDAILKGARPGDLPVEQPTKFDLAINLATAKALGVSFPQSILAQATIVTE